MNDDEDDGLWIFDDIECEEVQLECEGEEGVYVKLHGGGCCGVKHIHNMGSDPSEMLCEQKAKTGSSTSFARHACSGVNDAHSADYPEDFFCEAAPKETRVERLDRVVAFIKKYRPHGICEMVLVTSQKTGWEATLVERGWIKTTPSGGVRNSNTSNYLHVFHLYY